MVTTLDGSDRGYVDATGAAAQFSTPYGVAVDAQAMCMWQTPVTSAFAN